MADMQATRRRWEELTPPERKEAMSRAASLEKTSLLRPGFPDTDAMGGTGIP